MDRRTRRLFVLALVLVIGLAGGTALLQGPPDRDPDPTALPSAVVASDAPSVDVGGSASAGPPASPGVVPPSPLTGVIVAVDSRGLDDVRAFTLRTVAGDVFVFDLREMQDTATFPLGHLAEHQATAEPVIVTFRAEDGVLLATAVDDA